MNFIKTNGTLFRVLRKIPSLNNQTKANQSSLSSQKCNMKVYVSICVERQPVITQEKTAIEEKIQKILQEVEFERSIKSNFELLKEGKLQQLNKIPEEYIGQTSVDIEDKCRIQLENLKMRPRTLDDKADDLNNRLSTSLFLLTGESNKTDKDAWLLPKGVVNEGETLKQAAQRILNTSCGDTFKTFLYGNAPIGYSVHKSEDNKRKERVFYFLAKYKSGSTTTKNQFKWLTVDELVKVLPQDIYKHIQHVYTTSK